ncbi:hypothetical protein D3C81_2045440 [compost metagenome]
MAFIALHIVVRADGRFRVEAWIERRLGDFVLALGRLHVSLGGLQIRVVVDHALLGFTQFGRQFATG